MAEKNENKLTLDSKIGQLYETPIGKDLIDTILLQVGKKPSLITNPIVSNLKLKTLASLTKKNLGENLFDTLITLVNTEKDEPAQGKGEITHAWWKEAVFYQIYPRTFCDSNGDEVGDIPGIISKLDYIQELGVDAIWISPIYDSPMDDNGYDIRDYKKILKDFGTMGDFDKLLSQVHKRGMKLIMDLVINHTSDEHEWFKSALKDKNSKYHDYYLFRPNPNNWTSMFSGSAWNYYKENDEYALHLFSKKQMDLNWENSEMRHEIMNMINWWLDKGVDGFRMDVINLISKRPGLPDGDEGIGKMVGITGIENYFYGPRLHEYLKQINAETFEPHKAFSVGETPGLGMQMAKLITGEERHELSMVFNFDQLENPGHNRFEGYEYDLNYLKEYLINWQLNYGNNCWQSLFYNNHDNPKMVSKVTKDKTFHQYIKILLATIQFTMKGTPFVFQGEEMGLINYEFSSIDEINDVESRNRYQDFLKEYPKEKAFEMIKAGTRDNARILLPWNTQSKNPLVHQQKSDDLILACYKLLIAMRHNNSSLVYGDFEVLRDAKDVFTYKRSDSESCFIVDCNLGKKTRACYKVGSDYQEIFSSGDFVSIEKKDTLKDFYGKENCLGPYQVILYEKRK